ncbi:hypothetical protein T05_7611 [Trichinella murrelli]|uniref:RNase H type-1 domain-containing protein n=1 Tax=Trichinella murrelli TaxID=144512 RepID=A0A0V0TBQ2_9BILA|nr:hypothetical protein T05_7611 [Trichinella murrelli]
MELAYMDLHGFADASGSAHGAVVYLRLHENGKVEVRFLAAKSRVAPIKKLSLPRLELMAALLCARLVAYVKREADLPIRSCFCWSDSLVPLCWIRSNAQRWKPFVSNQMRDIQEIISSDSWRYCPTQDNPADLASRGWPEAMWYSSSNQTFPVAGHCLEESWSCFVHAMVWPDQPSSKRLAAW